MAAVEGMESPVVESVRGAHKRAQKAIKGTILDILNFELDAKRATTCQNIEMSKMQLAELNTQTVALPMKEDAPKSSN